MFLSQLLGASDVYKSVGFTIELKDLFLAHAVAFAARIISAERPAIAKAVRFEGGQHGGDVAAGVGGEVIETGIVNPAARIFDVIGIVTEPPQTEHKVEELERDACQRVPEEDPENDNFSLARHQSLPLVLCPLS